MVVIALQVQTWIQFLCVTQDPEMVPLTLDGMMTRMILILQGLVRLSVKDPGYS